MEYEEREFGRAASGEKLSACAYISEISQVCVHIQPNWHITYNLNPFKRQ